MESCSEGVKNIRKRSWKISSFNSLLVKESGSRKKILNPQGQFLQKWNKIFVLSCVIALSLDPLFFYIPVIDDDKKCLGLDKKLEKVASVLRSFTDIFYIIHIIFQFRTGFIAPSSRVFGRGDLVEDSWLIAKRYISSYFLIDILAVLPLPQVRFIVTFGLDPLLFANYSRSLLSQPTYLFQPLNLVNLFTSLHLNSLNMMMH